MREIKFRAWNIKHGMSTPDQMRHDGLVLTFDGRVLFDNYADESLRWEIMQYTGLNGKNGVCVYEDDIVTAKTNIHPACDVRGKVVFEDGEYLVEQDDCTFPMCSFAVIDRLSIEVIGNVHQDSHLLDNP